MWLNQNWLLWSDFLQFANTNLVIQNSVPKFRQSSIISEKPSYLYEKFKTLQAPATTKFNIAEI